MTTIDPPDSYVAGTVGKSYRLDGLLSTVAFPSSLTETLAYDAVKRPLQITLSNSAGTIGQAFDRAGRVTADTRSLAGVTGAAGTGSQTFSYDSVSRLVSSSIPSVDARSYQYDLDGNRSRRVENGTTSDVTYDRTDVAVDQVIAGTTRLFSYDRYGNLTQAPDKTSVYTTYGYDEASRPVSMAIAGGSTATFAVDPLDRKATRTVGGVIDTYGYQGSTEVAFETGSSGTRSLLDVDGSRLAVKNGSSVAWVLFDLHGSVAGLCSGTSVTDAYRYDAFGQTMASYSSGSATANPWKYRGLLGVAPGTNTDLLYDMSARDYAPNLGTFTQWDSVQGSAANPLSMNRYLYALANPATLVDPDGHVATEVDGCRPGDAGCAAKAVSPIACQKGDCGVTRTRQSSPAVRRPARRAEHQAVCSAAKRDCSLSDIRNMSIDKRVQYLEGFQKKYDPDGWLDGLTGFVKAARDNHVSQTSWFGVVDAYVIHNLQEGYSAFLTNEIGDTAPTEAWRTFYAYTARMKFTPASVDQANALVAVAEYRSIAEGRLEADALGVLPTIGERDAYFMADTFRALQQGRAPMKAAGASCSSPSGC